MRDILSSETQSCSLTSWERRNRIPSLSSESKRFSWISTWQMGNNLSTTGTISKTSMISISALSTKQATKLAALRRRSRNLKKLLNLTLSNSTSQRLTSRKINRNFSSARKSRKKFKGPTIKPWRKLILSTNSWYFFFNFRTHKVLPNSPSMSNFQTKSAQTWTWRLLQICWSQLKKKWVD